MPEQLRNLHVRLQQINDAVTALTKALDGPALQAALALLLAERSRYEAELKGTGAIAQGDGAQAVGEKGILVGGIPLPPADLNPETLQSRLRRLYLPVWLVDADVVADWRAEVGFDYEVVSHQDRYAAGAGWQSERVREQRARWEPRVGRLVRHYDNITAPALERQAVPERLLRDVDMEDAVLYRTDILNAAVIRAPDLDPEAAWPEAVPSFRLRAAAECREASQADHIRKFQWRADYTDQNWTLLLLPSYASYYLDDEGAPQRVLLNGQTGEITGARCGSMARAQRMALTVGIVAVVIFLLSLAVGLMSFLFPPLLAVGIIGVLLALVVGVGAFVSIARVWSFNRRQAALSAEV